MKDEKAWKWLNENDLSYDIWEKKYRYNNESFDDWLERVSGGNKDLKNLIYSKKFLPGGRILANRGIKNKRLTYSNCYVIPAPEDNIESIFECAKNLARTYSYGGGCGIDISKLRPKGATVNNAAKESTGAVSFMDIYSQVTGTISQQGRRGALMISIDINHPDVTEFIDCKTDLNRINFANISVRVNDEFMKAVENDEDYLLQWPLENCKRVSGSYDLLPYNELCYRDAIGVYVKKVKARELFNKLVENNWNYAEPGILYWDRMENYNLLNTNSEFKYGGINPCGELPLPEGGSCLLGSINLAEITSLEELKYVTSIAVTALNDILDEGLELHPLQCQKDTVRDWRQIGLGTMGLSDYFIKHKVRYGSQSSLDLIDSLYATIAKQAIITSSILALNKGAYPKCNKEAILKSSFFNQFTWDKNERVVIAKNGLRNSQLLTCAPTGTIATMLGISTGLEPIFAMKYTRTTKSLDSKDKNYEVYTPIAKKWLDEHSGESLPNYFVDSSQITPEERVLVQSTIQKWVDGSLSSTCNLPESATKQDVYNIYMQAWKSGCKGTTIFRSGCARAPILSTSSSKSQDGQKSNENGLKMDSIGRGIIVKAGDDCVGLKRTLMTGCGTLHCSAFFDPVTGDLRETYLSKGSTGGCNNFMVGLSRMISLAARGGITLDRIVDQLKSSGTCPSYAVRKATKGDVSLGSCCPVAVGNALIDMHKEMLERIKCCSEQYNTPIQKEEDKKDTCPECGAHLEHTSGCVSCPSCGYSKCG